MAGGVLYGGYIVVAAAPVAAAVPAAAAGADLNVDAVPVLATQQRVRLWLRRLATLQAPPSSSPQWLARRDSVLVRPVLGRTRMVQH